MYDNLCAIKTDVLYLIMRKLLKLPEDTQSTNR